MKKEIIIFGGIILFSILLTILIYYLGTTPKEERGNNIQKQNLSFEVYILNNEISKDSILSSFEYAKKIWGIYNISIDLIKIINLKENLSLTERNRLFDFNTFEENCSEKYNPLIEKMTNYSLNYKIIVLDKKNSSNAGRGCICGCRFVMISTQDKLLGFLDFTKLNLAHEIGHILGLNDINYGKRNLMNHRLFLKSFFSNFLNQTQVNQVTSSFH